MAVSSAKLMWAGLLVLLLPAAVHAVAVITAGKSYSTQLIGKSGTTDEKYSLKVEYCKDFTDDGKDDIKITVAINQGSFSGTEDCEGVAFDLQGDTWPAGLTVASITRETFGAGTKRFEAPAFLIDRDQITGNILGLDINGDANIKSPFDVAVKSNKGGMADGTVQAFSFILTADVALDASSLLSNTDWFVRSQSTNGGGGSAKTTGAIGTIPGCSVPTCADTNGDGDGVIAFICTGVYSPKADAGAIDLTGIANDNNAWRDKCCDEAPTCADINGATDGVTEYECPDGYDLKGTADTTALPADELNNRRDACCVQVATCADTNGADDGGTAVTCPGGSTQKTGYSTIELTVIASDRWVATCCDQGATCADMNGAADGVTEYECPGGYDPKADLGTIPLPADVNSQRGACCNQVPTCADTNGADDGGTAVTCPGGSTQKTGYSTIELTVIASDRWVATCCDQGATCADMNGAADGVTEYECPGGYDPKADLGTIPLPADVNNQRGACCNQVPTCADTNGADDGGTAVTCPGGSTQKTGYSTIELTVIASDRWVATCCDQGATCADMNGAADGVTEYECPGGYDPKADLGTIPLPADVNNQRGACCNQVPTCADTNGADDGGTAVTCPGGSTQKTGYSTIELTVIASDRWVATCCDQDATCADMNGAAGSVTAFECPGGYDPIANPELTPLPADVRDDRRDACCVQVPTCSDTNGITAGTPAVTCPDGWSRKADFATTELTGINNVNNNWRDRCCDQNLIPPPITVLNPLLLQKDGPATVIAACNAPVENTLRCDLGDGWILGNTVLITVPAVASGAQAFGVNTATVYDNAAPPHSASDDHTVVVFANIPADVIDVIVTKTVNRVSAVIGQGDNPTFDFTVTLTAAAGSVVVNPTVIDSISSTGLELLGAVQPSAFCQKTSLQAFSCGWLGMRLEAGQSVTVTYTAVARQAGTFVNTAKSAPAGDKDPNNNEAAVTVTVTEPQPGPPELAVSKTGPDVALVNAPVIFVVTAGVAPNSTPAAVLTLVEQLDSPKAEFVEPLPDPPNCKLDNKQRATCTWNNVGAGDTKTLQFTVKGSDAETIKNVATVSSANATPKSAEKTVILNAEVPPAEVKFTLLKDGPGRVVAVNEEFDFTLTANLVSGTMPSVTLVDTPPVGSGITFLRATPAAACEVTASLLSCKLTGPWPQTVKLTAVGTVAGTFENVALLSGQGNPTDSANVTVFLSTCGEVMPGGKPYNKCPAGYEYDSRFAGKSPANDINCCTLKAQSAPDIIVVKRVSDAKVQVGQDVTFTIQVTHQAGLSDTIAEKVVVSDTLPAGLKPYTDRWSVTPDVGPNACTFDAANTRKLTCALGTIAMGDTRTIAIPCLADGSQIGKLSNVAVVNCDTPGQGTVDPKCKKTSPPAVVTVEKVPEVCNSTLGISVVGVPKKAGKGGIFTWNITLIPKAPCTAW
ncbi:hypothetical protein OEZ86_008892 [Tetradesmus obliquus]|nr:hypothetical protein OEZ86_008892 [Tetradesmus obliquus]